MRIKTQTSTMTHEEREIWINTLEFNVEIKLRSYNLLHLQEDLGMAWDEISDKVNEMSKAESKKIFKTVKQKKNLIAYLEKSGDQWMWLNT